VAPTNPADSRVDLVEIRMNNIASSEASITYCHVDGGVLVQTGGGVDGADLVINDAVASILREAEVERSADGRWRMTSRRSTKLFDNGKGCDQ